MKKFRITQKLINLIKANLENTKIKVKIANFTSHLIKVITGLRQGAHLSMVLFNLILKKSD